MVAEEMAKRAHAEKALAESDMKVYSTWYLVFGHLVSYFQISCVVAI